MTIAAGHFGAIRGPQGAGARFAACIGTLSWPLALPAFAIIV